MLIRSLEEKELLFLLGMVSLLMLWMQRVMCLHLLSRLSNIRTRTDMFFAQTWEIYCRMFFQGPTRNLKKGKDMQCFANSAVEIMLFKSETVGEQAMRKLRLTLIDTRISGSIMYGSLTSFGSLIKMGTSILFKIKWSCSLQSGQTMARRRNYFDGNIGRFQWTLMKTRVSF